MRVAYFACMLIATVVATIVLRQRQRTLPVNTVEKFGIAIGGLVGATFAAKLPFILSADPSGGVLGAWLSDGKTVLWGLTGGYIGVEVAKWALHVKVSTGDTFVVPIALAVAIGRVGCFLFGCCYGVATNQGWGVRFLNASDGGTVLRHPTQLYELLFHLSFAIIASMALSGSTSYLPRQVRGNWMPLYLIAYSIYRFFSEYLRPEEHLSFGWTFYQWSSLVIASAFSGLLVVRGLRSQK